MDEREFLAKIGHRIKELRLKNNMSQTKLAEICHTEKANMSRIESGKTNITVLTLKKISEALNAEIIEFVKNLSG